MIADFEEGPDETDVNEAGPVEDRPTRGLLWVLGPALLGVLIGSAVGVIRKPERELSDILWTDGGVGVGVGLLIGLAIWVCYPYKTR